MIKPLDNPIPGSKFNEEIKRKRLRDQFAGRAMEALLANMGVVHQTAKAAQVTPEEVIGSMAYQIADGMMKARDGK